VPIFSPAQISEKLRLRFPLKVTPISAALRQKQPRLKLGRQDYNMMRERVLRRDSWRCQECGSMENLQVHHMKRRSQLGGDVMDNLITLCADCHGKCHGWARW
jgi:5-methylcytosine-specific restriction endonuclease McrA